MTEDIKSPFGSDFGKPRPYDFDTIGFSKSELRALACQPAKKRFFSVS